MIQDAAFWILDKYSATGDLPADTEFLDLDDSNKSDDAPKCPRCGQYIGLLEWLPPYEVDLECHGTEFGDLVFGPGHSFLVSERFADLFRQAGLTGLAGFDPVRVRRTVCHRRVMGEPPRYLHVTVRRSRAVIDQVASGFVWGRSPQCDECHEGHNIKRWDRIVIEPHTWNGEDIFIARGLFGYVCSPRFKRFCDKHQIRNAILIPADQYWHDSYPWENMEKGYEIMRLPIGGPIMEKIRPNGDIVRFDQQNNYVILAVREEGRIRVKGITHAMNAFDVWNRL